MSEGGDSAAGAACWAWRGRDLSLLTGGRLPDVEAGFRLRHAWFVAVVVFFSS